MWSKEQDDLVAARLEAERQERVADKEARPPLKPSTTLNGPLSDAEMDRQAARDGLNPNW